MHIVVEFLTKEKKKFFNRFCCHALFYFSKNPFTTKNGLLLLDFCCCFCPASTEFESDYTALLLMNYSESCNFYPTEETLLTSHYFIINIIADTQISCIP